MPPQKVKFAPIPQKVRMREEELFFEKKAKEFAVELARPFITWVDLPPILHPSPSRPPHGAEIVELQEKVSPDKRLGMVYVIGADEMAFNQLDPFLNEDKTLLTIAPHSVNMYQANGPISNELFGPVGVDFVRVYNDSQMGQSWQEVAVTCADDYVKRWVDAQPSVTILCLGFWDCVLGLIAWTPESSNRGVYGRYYMYNLDLFLSKAREYCRSQRRDFEAWMSVHIFLILQIPNWAKYTRDLETPQTISVATWDRLRKHSYHDMYQLERVLWEKYNAVLCSPFIPHDLVSQQEEFFRLGEKFSRLYIAQILAKAAKLICVRPCCRLPPGLEYMKDVLYEKALWAKPSRGRAVSLPKVELGSCGKFYAFFFKKGQTMKDFFH